MMVVETMAEKKKDAQTASALRGINFDAWLRFVEVGLIEHTHVHNGGTLRKRNLPNMRVFVLFTRVQAGGELYADVDA